MQALIHVQETCVWLGALAVLVAAMALLEPQKRESTARSTSEASQGVGKVEVPVLRKEMSWWQTPSG